MKSDFYIVIQEAIFIPYNLFRLSGRKQHTSVYCQSDLLQEIFLTSRQSCLQSDGKVHNPICKLTSSEAILSAILYTKKQIKFHFVKSKILPICWFLTTCPAMSKYVRLCPNFKAKNLTFQHQIFFDGKTSPSRFSGIADFFSPFIRIFTGFFVNLWKHNGNSYPTDALKSRLVLEKNYIRAASYGLFHISY